MTTPKPWLALLLNFVLPGAGLLYLPKWKQAIVNFPMVVVVPLVLFFGVADSTLVEHIHYVFLALAAASAGALVSKSSFFVTNPSLTNSTWAMRGGSEVALPMPAPTSRTPATMRVGSTPSANHSSTDPQIWTP